MVVGQQRALALAVRGWRRDARHTAFEGLLTGGFRDDWPAGPDRDDGAPEELEDWEGLMLSTGRLAPARLAARQGWPWDRTIGVG